MLSREFTKFVLVGGAAAVVNFTSRIFLNELMSYRWAVFWAYLVGMTTAYILQRLMVFGASVHHPIKEMVYFSLVNVAAIIQVWLISVGLAEYFFPYLGFDWYPKEIAHAIGISIPAVTSYYGHKYISFKKSVD